MSGASELKALCDAGGVVRRNYYSTTYRTSFSLNGDAEQNWDIQHIQIPFPKQMEAKLRARFRLKSSELPEFYNLFVQEIKQHLIVTEELKALNDADNIRNSTVFCESRKLDKNAAQGQTDIFIVTQPATALVGSSILRDNGAMKSEILQLGTRLLQSVKNYNDRGYSIGTFDLDSMVVEMKDGRAFIKNNFFLASTATRGSLSQFTPDLQTHMPDDVASGDAGQSYNGDIYAVCSILWALLGGTHWTEKPDLSKKPAYCGDELTEMLRQGMEDGAAAFRELSRALRQELSAIKNGTATDMLIPFQRPAYMAEYEKIDAAFAAAREEAARNEEEAQEVPAPDPKAKLKKAIPIFLILLAVMMGGIFAAKKMLTPTPAPVETPVVTPAPTPTPTPDPKAGKPDTDSHEVGLFTYNGTVVDAQGNPTSRFYLNADGDIEYNPALIPARMSELELSDDVLDLSQSDFSGDVTKDSITLDAESILNVGIEPGKLLLPPDWDMAKHLRKVESVTVAYTWDVADSEETGETPNEEEEKELVITPEDLLKLTEGEDWTEVFTECLMRSMLPGYTGPATTEMESDASSTEDAEAVQESSEAEANSEEASLRAEIKAAIESGSLHLPAAEFTVTLSDSGWYEQYKYCDANLYRKLKLVEREGECDVIKERTTNVNGESMTLYYDDAGNTYDAEQWNAQEALRAEIEEAKTELDKDKGLNEPVILVPSWGIEEYVYTESIEFSRDPIEVKIGKTSYGSPVSQNFVVDVSLYPLDSTCREVEFVITPAAEKGFIVPYSYNADFITGKHNTYDQLTEFVADFTNASNGTVGIAFNANEFGEYTIEARAGDRVAAATIRVIVTDDSGTIPEETTPVTPTPAPTPTPPVVPGNTGGGNTGGGNSGGGNSGGGNSGGGTPPVIVTPVPTPIPTPVPTPVVTPPPVIIDETFTVTPASLTLKVGETAMLSPSMSCRWSASAPSVAWIGGEQGRTVTAVAPGVCTITATTGDGQTFTITITVIE